MSNESKLEEEELCDVFTVIRRQKWANCEYDCSMGCQQCTWNRVEPVVEHKSNAIEIIETPISTAPQIHKVTSPPPVLVRQATPKSQSFGYQNKSKKTSPVIQADDQEPVQRTTIDKPPDRIDYPESFSELTSTNSDSSAWTDCSDETAEPVIATRYVSRSIIVRSAVSKRLYPETISAVSSDSDAPDSCFRPIDSSTPNSEFTSPFMNARFIFSPLQPHPNVPLQESVTSLTPKSPRPCVKINASSPKDLPSQPSAAEQPVTDPSKAMHTIAVRSIQSATSKLSKSEVPRRSSPSETSSQSDGT